MDYLPIFSDATLPQIDVPLTAPQITALRALHEGVTQAFARAARTSGAALVQASALGQATNSAAPLPGSTASASWGRSDSPHPCTPTRRACARSASMSPKSPQDGNSYHDAALKHTISLEHRASSTRHAQVTDPSGCFREEVAPVMSSYPQAASSLVVRLPDLQRWPDHTYLVATRDTPCPAYRRWRGARSRLGITGRPKVSLTTASRAP